MQKVKRFFFPGATLILSFYISFLFAIGIIFGYLTTKYFDEKLTKRGRVKMIFLNFRKWRIHLHHWIIGTLLIFSIYIFNLLSSLSLPIFYTGALGGMIFHGVYSYKNWYKIISRR